jgi:hypothetical protein
MANKRRPKKAKPPYRKYGPGLKQKDDDEEEDDDEKSDVITQSLGALKIAQDDYEAVFPTEIFQLIMLFLPKLDPKFLRVSKMFYYSYLPLLYQSPYLNSHNFHKFVESLAKDKAHLVRSLNLSTIIQSGKNSYVSKVLRRCFKLQLFTAPQTSFGYAPLVSLRNCKDIEVLDLGLVSETMKLNELFQSIKSLKKLTKLSFPRSSIQCEDCDESIWPPNLWYLRLSGGISESFLSGSKFPDTIKRLELAHCPLIKEFSIYSMLNKCGDNLTHLSILYPMPGLKNNSMDFLFMYCPNLQFLQIYVDYCSNLMFGEDLLPMVQHRPLRTLWIESSGGLGQSSKIHPDDLTIAIMEDRLPHLKSVRITSRLGWDLQSDDVGYLASLLEEREGGLYVSYH